MIEGTPARFAILISSKPASLFFEIDQHWGNRLLSARYQYLYSRRFFVTTTAYRSSYAAREGTLIRPTTASLVDSDYRVRLRDLAPPSTVIIGPEGGFTDDERDQWPSSSAQHLSFWGGFVRCPLCGYVNDTDEGELRYHGEASATCGQCAGVFTESQWAAS